MCGIAGVAALHLPPDALDIVRSMMNSLARRGPDAEGLHEWPCTIFGHRRLAIFDLSDAGRQPMVTANNDTGVVFNGALYNFRELRRHLQKFGYQFRSDCDTEVLLHGYRAWGIDELIARLRGMFAFALWDEPKRRLYLARDRLGVKPLVYAASGGRLVFASTVAALQAAGVADDIDPRAVRDFLQHGWVPDERSIFTNVRKLPAATLLEWADGRILQRRYWAPPKPQEARPVAFSEAAERAEDVILDAVRVRLDADVPVGALLSAGIDSAIVCWAMAKLNANIQSFTISTPGDAGDEAAGAIRTAKILGIPHEIISLPSSERPALDDLVSAYGEPFAVASALGMLRVSRAVRKKVTVLLTGDGGDDVFLGYPRHRHLYLAQHTAQFLSPPVAQQWSRVRPLAARFPALRRAIHFVDYSTGGLGPAVSDDTLSYYDRHRLLGQRLMTIGDSGEVVYSLDSARQVLSQFIEYERRMRFVSEYMTKVDGATMFYALEARSPFLDQHVWEFAEALPYDTRLYRHQLKAVLRAIVRKCISPEVSSRRKQGFSVPVSRWLAADCKQDLEILRCGSMIEREGWVRHGALEECVDEAIGAGHVPAQLWRVLVLEHWLRKSARHTNLASVTQQ
jgi:asparagine synthase (glutamine-hydrolysing)